MEGGIVMRGGKLEGICCVNFCLRWLPLHLVKVDKVIQFPWSHSTTVKFTHLENKNIIQLRLV